MPSLFIVSKALQYQSDSELQASGLAICLYVSIGCNLSSSEDIPLTALSNHDCPVMIRCCFDHPDCIMPTDSIAGQSVRFDDRRCLRMWFPRFVDRCPTGRNLC